MESIPFFLLLSLISFCLQSAFLLIELFVRSSQMPAIAARIGLTRHFLLFFCVYNHVLCEIVNVFKLAILLVYENTNKQLNYSC